MPLVSIITPTQAHNADHLDALWRSIAAQALPGAWEWEWLVQEDGAAPRLRPRLAADPRVRYDALGVQAGGPAARNAALLRARGDVVAGIDHDDLYADGGLAALVAALDGDRAAAWACGRCVWHNPDGGEWVKPDVLAPGRVIAGTVAARFVATDDFPFPAAFAAYRRPHLVAHGGWPAVVRSADAVLLAAFSTRWDGVWVDRVVATYRRWERQATVRPADIALRDLPHVRGAIAQRLEAEQALGLAPVRPEP